MSSTALISRVLADPFKEPELNWLYIILTEMSGGDGYVSIFPFDPERISKKSRIPLKRVNELLAILLENRCFELVQNSGKKYGQFNL